jgi:hypothetical protein
MHVSHAENDMPVVLKRPTVVSNAPPKKLNLLVHALMFGAAILFAGLLRLTYGLDLSPGLF